ncbi:granzyme B(G,H)-like [Menidia menidia]
MLTQHNTVLLYLLASLGQSVLGSEIINGKKVPEKLMAYMASVQSNGRHVCGGFLISEDFVVTAAHCEKDQMDVVLGTHNLKKVDDGKMRYNVTRCKHPDFQNVKSGRDIMLLKLSRRARLGVNLQPIRLPEPGVKLRNKAKCRVAGWGFTKTAGEVTDALLVADVHVVDQDTCRKRWKPRGVELPDNVLCAGGYGSKKGFCQGDSGGPLVFGPTAVGIVSFNFRENCDYPNVPNVYTDISKYLPWIKRIVKKKHC